MVWKVFEDNNLAWPNELSATVLKKADKKKQCESLIDILETGEKEFGKLVNKREQPPQKGAHSKAARWVKSALALANGTEVKSVNATLKLAQAEAKKTLMGKAAVDKSAASFMIKMQRIAGQAQTDLDRRAMVQTIGTIGKKIAEAHKEYTLGRIGAVLKTMKACSTKGHPGLKKAATALKGWEDGNDEGNKEVANAIRVQVYNTSRDMTQNIKNITQAAAYGGEIPGLQPRDLKALPKMLKVLEPLANESGSSEISKMDKADLKSTILIVGAQAKLFDMISKRLP